MQRALIIIFWNFSPYEARIEKYFLRKTMQFYVEHFVFNNSYKMLFFIDI